MRSRRAAHAALLGLLAVLAAVLLPGASPAAAATRALAPSPGAVAGIGVTPDPAHDLYVGTGGLVVPARDWRGDGSGRVEAAGCVECTWRVSRLCTKDSSSVGACGHIRIGCPVGTIPVRIWLLRPGQDWAVVGEACQGDSAPVTVTDVGSAVRDRAEAALPPLRPGMDPARGALVSVPAVFRTGQPAGGLRGADLSVLGLDVVLDARARWLWRWGDGGREWTSSPGGRWPDLSVAHVYRRALVGSASVAAVWRAQFTVEGLGPFAVPGPALQQTAAITVVVREARARLVG